MTLRHGLAGREAELYEEMLRAVRKRTDGIFVWLFAFEWALAVAIACARTPLTWDGTLSDVHPHVWFAVLFGGLLSLYPIALLQRRPGELENGYVACVSQILYSTLLIHITDGRIETHFHIFGSLAFLSFYRDSRLILLATGLTAMDHLLRGAFAPLSVYGVDEASVWRAVEHACWVVFEDIFLLMAIRSMGESMGTNARKTHALEQAVANTERLVVERTRDLEESQRTVLDQQQSLVNAARLSSLGEMAAGIAHEINNPLAVITLSSKLLRRLGEKGKLTHEAQLENLDEIDRTVLRISAIIKGLRNISRDAHEEVAAPTTLKEIFDDVLSICVAKFKNHDLEFIFDEDQLKGQTLNCRRVQISQVLMNLLGNAYDAIKDDPGHKWIKVEVLGDERTLRVLVSDSGKGIPQELKAKIFRPFFTTKEVGVGTGLGLSLSRSIVEKHGGALEIAEDVSHTQFVVSLPRKAA